MSLKIDLPTVLLFYNTSLVAGALSIMHLRLHSCRPQGLGQVAAAYALLAIGSAIAWSGELEALPAWFWTHASLLLGTAGYSLFWVGMRQFSGRRRVPGYVAFLPPVGVLVLGIVTGFPSENLYRAGAFHGAATLALAASAFDTLHDRRYEPLPSRNFLATLLALSAGIYAVRLVYIIDGTAGPIGFSWAFYAQMFCYFGVALVLATMSNERAEIRLEQAALTDPLTGTGNRRWLALRLPASLPANSAVAHLDLDRFKQINDRFGHTTGDRVLFAFAQCLKEELRSSDLLARTGGEEFVIYLPAVSETEAKTIAQRLCEKVAALQIEQDGVRVPITVSIGLAWVHKVAVASEAWLKEADAALYQAKFLGRNQVVSATPSRNP